jgi:hypothetical protein
VCRWARGAVVGARCAVPGVVFVPCSAVLQFSLLFRLATCVPGLCCPRTASRMYTLTTPCAIKCRSLRTLHTAMSQICAPCALRALPFGCL